METSPLTETIFYILLSLYTPLHGYGIMQNVRTLSKERVNLGAGTLYGAINTLVGKGWISPVSNEFSSRKKEYTITQLGKEMVDIEILRLQELLLNSKNIAGGSSHAKNS